jgi:hypothetical protein
MTIDCLDCPAFLVLYIGVGFVLRHWIDVGCGLRIDDDNGLTGLSNFSCSIYRCRFCSPSLDRCGLRIED